MARKKSKTLTEAEHRIMEVLWRNGSGSVKEVTEALCRDQALAYNTVLTMLRILKDKGYVAYRKQGRAFIYTPLVDKNEARGKVLKYLLGQFFNNSPSLLIQNLLEDEKMDAIELKRLKDRINESEREAD